jgi:hydrogenase nickel incorporation protein HypA/HybF
MHEYSIVQSLIDRVDDEARRRGATSVHRLEVHIGELSGVDARLLATAFETFREHTVCADATLDVAVIAADWRCPRCKQPPERGALLRCTTCNLPAQLAAGDEIILASIDMEVPSHVH